MLEKAEIYAKYIIKNKSTIRKTAKIYGVGKSTVHNEVSNKLQFINKRLYRKVQKILAKNFKEKHLRGGEATRLKYLEKNKAHWFVLYFLFISLISLSNLSNKL